jgi:hypothetical protein
MVQYQYKYMIKLKNRQQTNLLYKKTPNDRYSDLRGEE